jgi:large subunit ribosomal protein L5
LSIIKSTYYSKIIPYFIKNGLSKNIMDVPKFLKIVINIGFNSNNTSKKQMDDIKTELSLISAQQPVFTKAKKSIAGFKIKKGVYVGCKVTLRRDNMYNFLDKILFLVLPRIRDFKGLSSKSFDGTGNYNFSIKEQIVFPEINYDNIETIRGMDICIATSSKNNEICKTLFKALNFPLN